MIIDLTGKVKSCPMCGSNRIYMDEPKYDLIFCIKIQCADCGLNGFKNFTKDAKNPIEKTIEYWNTRVPSTVDSNDFDLHNYDGKIIYCPYCGEKIIIEYDTAKCEKCGWMAADSELEDIMEE